jgi:DNA-directed RNA polymerase beta' subunit
MALELFKPFIIRMLEEKGYVQTVKERQEARRAGAHPLRLGHP